MNHTISPDRALRVLLLDDDASIRRVASRVLRMKGFEVHECACPDTALAAIAADPSAFDVVITDAVMPGMTGPQVARRIEAMAPALPIILMSGYSADDVASASGSTGACRFIQKPFQPGELAAVITDVVTGVEAAAA